MYCNDRMRDPDHPDPGYIVCAHEGDYHAVCFLAHHDPRPKSIRDDAVICRCLCMECGDHILENNGCAIFRSPVNKVGTAMVRVAVAGHTAITHTMCLPAYIGVGNDVERVVFLNGTHD